MLADDTVQSNKENRFGEYTILGELGRGAMGVVLKAVDPALDRTVALKVLPQHLADDPEYVARFTQEARAAAQLNHPNVVTIYQIVRRDGRQAMAMEYVQGVELSEVMVRQCPMAIRPALGIARQIAAALSAAHEAGIVHRDIKPRNIMVDRRNRIKVTDFGIAKVGPLLSTVATADGKLIGTPAYMSPEQILGKEVDHRSDLYSLGVVLYQMLAGRTPFVAETPGTMMQCVLNETAPPIEGMNPNVPPLLAECIKRVLAKDPRKRHQSAEEFISALDAILPGETVVTVSMTDLETQILDAESIKTGCFGIFPLAWRQLSKRKLSIAGFCLLPALIAMILVKSNLNDRKPAAVSHLNAAEVTTSPGILITPTPTPTEGVGVAPVLGEGGGFLDFTSPFPSQGVLRITGVGAGQTGMTLREAIARYTGMRGGVDAFTAKKQLTLAAEAEDPMGQMWCAWFSYWGKCGFEKNREQARRWAGLSCDKVRKLAEQGDPDAIFLTGAALDIGLGARMDRTNAVEWILKAARTGHTTAMNYMGYLRFAGHKTPADLRQAFDWFQKAAMAGDVNAMHNLGWMYTNGDGVDKDNARAVSWFRRGTDAASAVNMNNLGWMYEQGRGVTKNRDEAIRWYRKAAILGDQLAAENLQKLGEKPH